jgi:hypothetical protein
MSKTLTIYICNLSEDIWSFIEAMNDEKDKQFEIAENANLADRDLLANTQASDLVFISPQQIDPDFVSYFQKIFGVRNLEILTPSNHTGQTSTDTWKDIKLLLSLQKKARDFDKVHLLSYSATPQFFELLAKLKEAGLNVEAPESPLPENSWTVNFFGSKTGIRQLVDKINLAKPNLQMSDGLVCVGVDTAAQIAAHKYLKEKGVVIKTNKGHSGAGILIYRPGDLPNTYEEAYKEIVKVMKKDFYWKKFPIVVESLVNIDHQVGGGCPNVEFLIKPSGRVKLLYQCGMIVTKDGVFQGVEVNDKVIDESVLAEMMDMGYYMGEKLAEYGYRGYFDVDMVAGKGDLLFLTESNTRRTGGTHVYHAAMKLIGDEFLTQSYILSNSAWPIPSKKQLSFNQVLEKIKPILYNNKTKEGLVLASANVLKQHRLAYIIFGKNKKRALGLETKLSELLAS